MKRKPDAAGFALCVCGLALAMAVQGCTSARSMKVTSEVGPGARFDSTATTFGWIPESDASSGDWQQVPYARARFRELVQAGLAAKGYQYKAEGTPDILLSDRLSRHVMEDWLHPDKELRYALLAFDAINPRTRQVTWRATADLELSPTTSREQAEATLREVVRRILKPVPPRTAGAPASTVR
jgi:hypothetical protein